MRLYRTANGQWVGTEAAARAATRREGSKPGSWRQVEVPIGKPGLLAFLNGAHVASPQEHEPTHAGAPVPARSKGSHRFRVYVKGIFACVVHADNDDLARGAAIGLLEVRAA